VNFTFGARAGARRGVPGVWARDHAAGQAYAEAHGIKVAHASYEYEGLCADPEVDIIYIASKTFDHRRSA
jgi:predicted dehydrogenase